MLYVVVLGIVSFFADVQSEIIFPLLPIFITQDLGLAAAFLGLVEGAADATAAVFKYFSGYVCDRAGRHKWLMFAGYALSVVSKPVMAFARSGPAVLSLRVADRLGKGVRTSPRDALLASYTDSSVRARAFSLHRALDSAGAVGGVLVLYLLLNHTDLSHRDIFKLTIIPGVFVALAIVALVKQPKHVSCPVPPKIFDRRVAASWWPFLACHAVYSFGMLSYAFYILRVSELGVAVGLVPLVYLVFTVGQVIWPVPIGWLADRLAVLPVLAAAYLFQAAVLVAAGLLDYAWTLWPLFALYALYYQAFMALPPAFVSTAVPAERRGAGIGLLHMTSGLAILPGSITAGLIWDRWGGLGAFTFSAVCAAAAASGILIYHAARRRSARRADVTYDEKRPA
jgi:MFS family permease